MPVSRLKIAMLRCIGTLTILLLATFPAFSGDKSGVDYGTGLVVNIPLPEAEVLQVVKDTAQDGIIRGTKEYNKDEYVKGADAVGSSEMFGKWKESGQVFYKVRRHAIDPRNFKGSGDVGTLAVRYIVQPDGANSTVLRIDALYVEDFRHSSHLSNGSVESSEYKDIQERLDAIELMKKEAAEAEVVRQAELARKNIEGGQKPSDNVNLDAADKPATSSRTAFTPAVADLGNENPAANIGPRPGESLQEYALDLRRQVEKRVKFPGAPLKSAPFHSANTMASLPSGTEVLIVISTAYWFGVETRDGQHGWITREELEEVK
jgi:hypothetical protein